MGGSGAHVGHLGAPCGPFGAPGRARDPILGGSRSHVGHLGPPGRAGDTIWGAMWAIWGHLGLPGRAGDPIWGHLVPFGAIWDHLAAFGAIWGYLGPFGAIWIWYHLVQFVCHLGPIWAHLGAIWGPQGVQGTLSGADLGKNIEFYRVNWTSMLATWGQSWPKHRVLPYKLDVHVGNLGSKLAKTSSFTV